MGILRASGALLGATHPIYVVYAQACAYVTMESCGHYGKQTLSLFHYLLSFKAVCCSRLSNTFLGKFGCYIREMCLLCGGAQVNLTFLAF